MVETVPQFFAGRSIFVTGGSGFIGKVLVEKLLRSCPDIKEIYLLMRGKKGKSPSERLQDIISLPLFDVLKKEQPNYASKLKVVSGDVVLLDLGLSPEDRKNLIDTVSVVYHVAASVRFDDFLADCVIMNTRGTREVASLALQMKNIAVFCHISTTYCQIDKKIVDEKVYPPLADWRNVIKMAEEVDPHVLNTLTAKYMGEYPNTYCFSKSLAENVVNDMCSGRIPTIIYRPSIIVSARSEPIKGWIDNFNGPIGLLVASGKGLVKTAYLNPDVVADYVPVDIAVKGMITSVWNKGQEKDADDKILEVYNCSNNGFTPITITEIINIGKKISEECPFDNQLWYPCGGPTYSKLVYYVTVILLQIIPAIIIDLILLAVGQKPMLLKIQRKIYIATTALEYFTTNEWTFINHNGLMLEKKLHQSDVKDFGYDLDTIDVYQYFVDATLGAKYYLLKEDPSSMEHAKKHARKMWFLNEIVQKGFFVLVFWVIFYKYNLLSHIFSYVMDKYYFILSE